MMIFHCSIRDLVGRNSLSPNTFVDEKRGRRLRRLFGDALLSYESPKFYNSGPTADNRYRVVLRVSPDFSLRFIGGALRERVSRCCGGGEIRHATVSKDAHGKYCVSILCAETCEILPPTGKEVGIDLGIKELSVCSNGERIANPKFLEKGERHSKYLQRQVSKKKKGGKNRGRARMKLSRHYEHIANRRRDFTHKFTTRIVRDNQTVCVEDLNVRGMESNHHLSKSVASAAFGEIARQLEYKCRWYGRDFVKVGRWFPSSKKCNHCGKVNHGLTLKDRVWVCAGCGREIDRDYNAALNILEEGKRILSGAGAASDVKQKGGEAAA